MTWARAAGTLCPHEDDDHLDRARRAVVERSLDTTVDLASRHELSHPDAVLEFPQSGERFEGVVDFLPWRER